MSLTGDTANKELNNEGAVTQSNVTAPAKLVLFDFDGTSIEGNSPVLLVSYLTKKKMLRKRVIFRILLWAAAYKLRLPQNESWVRSLVFTAFEGCPVAEVDQFLKDFYDLDVAPRFRPQADEAMRKHQEEGCTIVVVSATFEPIILRAMEQHPIELQASTRMCTVAGETYTCKVEGLPVEGEEKLIAARRLADQRFGVGGWTIEAAYGDHHSDRAVLSAANHAYAVNPDRPLARTARENGWTILSW